MPDAQPKRPRRRFRRIFGAAAVALLVFIASAVLAVQHLDWIAKWSIHRIFPGVKAGLGSLRIVSASRLEVKKLSLKSSKTGEPLLALEGGTAVFSFGDIWRLHLDEVQLQQPNLVISPDLGDALGVQPAKSGTAAASSGSVLGWGIDHVVVSGGHLRITRFGEQSPTVDMDFSADFKDLGVGGETGKIEHALRIGKIAAMDAKNRAFLNIADADIRFTTEELFTGNHIRAARIGNGSLTVEQSLINVLSPHPKGGSAAAGSQVDAGQPGWSVGSLKLDGLHVTIPDAPGVIGKVDFRIAVALQNLGAVGSPAAEAMQSIVVKSLKVSTDAEPKISLLTASEAEVKFTIAGLAAHRLEDLRLKDPDIDFSPSAIEAKPAASASAAPKSAAAAKPPAWLIARTSCNYGTLRLRGLQNGTLDATARLAFQMENLGTLGDAANAVQELIVWDVQASSGQAKAFISLDVGRVRFTTSGLLEHERIEAVKVDGGRVLVGDALQKILAGNSAAAQPQAGSAQPAAAQASGWSIGALDISGVRTRIEDKRPGVTDLHFTLNTSMSNVQASGVSGKLLEEVQTVELANIDLRSPINPASKILSLRSVFVRFTLRDLARRHLREIVILRPSIFLSQDLFIYMERASAAPAGAPGKPASAPAGTEPGWSVDHLEVKFGRLVIGSGGQADVGLPLEFETTADNLALDNLAALQLQTVLRVRKQSRDFPDYQLAVEDAEGDLRFAYPPGKGEKNLVQKLEIAGVRWRQYRAKKTWVAVTFDARGINGEFGGEAYSGYLNGGFSFFFGSDSPWIGWIAGTDVDTQSLTGVISPQNFRMTGPLNFEVQLDAFRKEIDRVRGVFHLTQPGSLKIGKLDDVLANIPPTWAAIKSSSTRIALETLRDFDYTTASGDLWFVQSQGILNLDLSGPNGSRKFEVALHDDQETQSKWQQGKLGKK